MRRLLLAVCLVAPRWHTGLAQGEDAKAKLPISVGDEFTLAADGPGKNVRSSPAVAYGGGVYLCVWREGWEGRNGAARIRAARIPADGRTADPRPIEVAPNSDRAAPQEYPRVAFCKGTFLVVWHDLCNGTDYDVLAARLSAEGKLLDPTPIRVAAGPHNQVLPDVAADDRGFLVVWQGYASNDRAFHGYAARIDLDGKIGSPSDVGLSPCLRVAWNGASFLVACGGAGPVGSGLVRRVGPEGQPEKAKPAQVTTRFGAFSLSAVPGKGWVYVTHRSKPDPWGWGGPGAIRSYFVCADGIPDTTMPREDGAPKYALQPNWLEAAPQDRATWPFGLSACAWDGKQTVVVWARFHCTGEKRSTLSNGDIVASRTDGWRRQGDVAVPVAASEFEEVNPSLASDGAGHLLCVYEKEVGPKTILCARQMTSR